MMIGCGAAEGVLTRCRLASPQSSCVSWPVDNMLSSVDWDEKQGLISVIPQQILTAPPSNCFFGSSSAAVSLVFWPYLAQ